jgi:serine/threonine protein kinase
VFAAYSDVVSSSGTKVWVYIVIAAAVVIVVLAAILLYQRYVRSRKGSDFSKSFDSEIGDTFNFDDTLEHVDSVFLNDPVIITSRVEYKELKVGKCISQGGFGLVFAGEFHGRRVAIKKIRPDRSNDVAGIEQFLKEIILMAQLYHPRIVEFIGVAWDVLRHLSAVNEFMDHGDLRNVLHGYKLQSTPLTWRAHKARISLHIAEALSYLHSLKPKVIHRDLKSKNVLLNLHLDAKLSDFGISRQRFRVETHMTVGVGTSFWIAPEVLLGKDYDERADIFSFGVVLSEIDTDDYPYWNDANEGGEARGKLQEAEILSLVAAGQKRPEFTIDCPPGILDIADCCLQKDPANRPSAAEIVVMLQHLIDEGVGLDGGSQAEAADSPASSPSSAYVGWDPRLP